MEKINKANTTGTLVKNGSLHLEMTGNVTSVLFFSPVCMMVHIANCNDHRLDITFHDALWDTLTALYGQHYKNGTT